MAMPGQWPENSGGKWTAKRTPVPNILMLFALHKANAARSKASPLVYDPSVGPAEPPARRPPKPELYFPVRMKGGKRIDPRKARARR